MFRHFSCCVMCSLYCCDPFLLLKFIPKLFDICCYCLQRLVLIMMNYCVINNFVDLTLKQLKNREYAGLGTNIFVKKSNSVSCYFSRHISLRLKKIKCVILLIIALLLNILYSSETECEVIYMSVKFVLWFCWYNCGVIKIVVFLLYIA